MLRYIDLMSGICKRVDILHIRRLQHDGLEETGTGSVTNHKRVLLVPVVDKTLSSRAYDALHLSS